MNLRPDDLRTRAAECLKRAERTSPANKEVWLRIADAYVSLAEEVERTPTHAAHDAR
jgi:hypothetical protein